MGDHAAHGQQGQAKQGEQGHVGDVAGDTDDDQPENDGDEKRLRFQHDGCSSIGRFAGWRVSGARPSRQQRSGSTPAHGCLFRKQRAPCFRSASLEIRRDKQPSLGPEAVWPRFEAQGAVRAEVAAEQFAVVPDRADDPGAPARFDTEGFGQEVGLDKVYFLGRGGRRAGLEIRLFEAEFLGQQQAGPDGLHELAPFLVALANGRGKRVQGEVVLDDGVGVFSARRTKAHGGQQDGVAGIALAHALEKPFAGLFVAIEVDFFQVELLAPGPKHERSILGGVLDDANLRAVEVGNRLYCALRADQNTLCAVDKGAGEDQAEGDFTAQGPGGVARQDVHLAAHQGREPGQCRQGLVGDPLGVAHDGGRDGTAEIHVQAAPAPVAVLLGKTGNAGADAAPDRFGGFDHGQDFAGQGRSGHEPHETACEKECSHPASMARPLFSLEPSLLF